MRKVLRSIPPITSTGRKVNPNAKLSGLAHMSIGRYMSERKLEKEDGDWDITKHSKSIFNKKIVKDTPKIILEPINCDKIVKKGNDLIITLDFKGIKLSFDNNSILVNYNGIVSDLILTTSGDIFEISIENKTNKYFQDEIYIPELSKIFDPSTINISLENNSVIITFKKY